jgi:hypothetical protein
LTDYTVTESDVTQHESALSITESQITDLQNYLTDYTVTQGDVTQHESSLSITESQITDLQNYLTSETTTAISFDNSTNTLSYTDETATTTDIDLSLYLDDTNLARLTSGTLDGSTGIATFTRDDNTTFTIDFSPLFDDTNLARITSASFNDTNGVLTLTRDDASTVTADLDGRYLQSFTDTLDSVTGRGNSTTNDITTTGVVTAADFNSTSDERLKENVATIENGLDVISQIRPVEFDWKESGEKSFGVIAQEIEQILPQVVATNAEDMKSVAYDKIIAFLIDAVKTLDERTR